MLNGAGHTSQKILVYGYGNPGRRDDGLGNEFVQSIKGYLDQEPSLKEWIHTESNYQLNVEDSELISNYDRVWFVDASMEEDLEAFFVGPVDPQSDVTFTSHSASPSGVLKLCEELFSISPDCRLIHIRGYDWSFQEGISDRARENLNQAVESLMPEIIAKTAP